jgi:hypothetical protein
MRANDPRGFYTYQWCGFDNDAEKIGAFGKFDGFLEGEASNVLIHFICKLYLFAIGFLSLATTSCLSLFDATVAVEKHSI